jgi:hypothetical protein
MSYTSIQMALLRKLLACAAGFGLVASTCIFIWSFFGGTLDKLGIKVIWLTLGTCLLYAPLIAIEYRAIRAQNFFGARFGIGKPKWIISVTKFLLLFFVINFGVFLIAGHTASPEIKDGAYVLSDHGQIIRTLTKTEYGRLKGGELRLFASGWILFYFVLISYWWFPRHPDQTPQ